MAVNKIGPTWILNETAKDVYEVSRGVLQAATTDNVQPIALMTAAAFGTTLPMCVRTRTIVENVVGLRNVPVLLQRLQAQIGWCKDDAAIELCRSDGGLRFLGLTAALSTMSSFYDASRCIRHMMQETTTQRQLLPTIGQVQDLVKAIHPRLVAADFAKRLVGAQDLLLGLMPSLQVTDNAGGMDLHHPCFEHISGLVDGTRRLYRIGEVLTGDETTYMIVKTDYCHPWVYAFLEWVAGEPPSVTDAKGQILLPQANTCRVMIVLDQTDYRVSTQQLQSSMQIELFEGLNSPLELFNYQGDVQLWRGLVPLSTLGVRLMNAAELLDSSSQRMFQEAVISVLQRVIAVDSTQNTSWPDAVKIHAMPRIPPVQNMKRVFGLMFGGRALEIWTDTLIATRGPINSLPFYEAGSSILRERCGCDMCSGFSRDLPHDTLGFICKVSALQSAVVEASAMVLSLSLFEEGCLDELRVLVGELPKIKLSVRWRELTNLFLDAGRSINKSLPNFHPRDLYEFALQMLGTQVTTTADGTSTLAASQHGQVAYSTLLNGSPLSGAYLARLDCFPGQLHWQGERYSRLRSVSSAFGKTRKYTEDVVRPESFLGSSLKLVWQVHAESEVLSLGLRLDAPEGKCMASLGPLVTNARHNLYLSRCMHESDTELLQKDQMAFFVTGPVFEEHDIPGDGTVQIAAVANNEDHRLWAFASAAMSGNPIVLRGKACLQCSLRLCRLSDTPTLIL